MKNKKRIIVVLGVYRSGTSALMKSLEVMGIPMMDFSKTYFNEYNEKGYWEDNDFFSLNMNLRTTLVAFRNHSQAFMPLTEKEVNFLCEQGFFEKASELVLKKLLESAPAPLGIKDPKFSVLLPFWKKVFKECGAQVSFLISLRNPLDVVASIDAAQELVGKHHYEKSFWIWISHILSCLEHTDGYERLLVDYDELVQDSARQVRRIAHAFRLEINEEELPAYCHDFIDHSLRHFHGEQDHFLNENFCRSFAMEMYEKLLSVAKDEVEFQKLKNSFEKWREQFLSANALLVLAEKNEYEMEELRQTVKEREQAIYELNKTVNKHMHSLAGCYSTIHQRNVQLASLVLNRD